MTKFFEGLGFDLANAFPCQAEGVAHFLESIIGHLTDAETHPDNFFLSRGQGRQDLVYFFLQRVPDKFRKRLGCFRVCNEIAKPRFIIPDRSLD